MSPTIKESNTLQVDLSRVNTPSVASKKISLGKVLLVATAVVAMIAFLYAEVKYGLVSYGISYAVANPWVIGAVAIAAVIGIAYLIYVRNNQSSSQLSGESQSNSSTQNSTLPAATQQTIRRITHNLASTEYGVEDPASEYEYEAAIIVDPSLTSYIRGHFPNRQDNTSTLEDAQALVRTRLQVLNQNNRACERVYNTALTTNTTALRLALDDWDKSQAQLLSFIEKRPLILYWLMNDAYID